jgi:signal peptidase I
MFPLLYNSSKALIIKPPEEDIVVGDIAVYNDPDGIYIVHRIVEMGYDETGVYYMTKGDNNPNIDPYLIRYNNLEGVVIAIIY